MLRVMVVDDEPMILGGLVSILKQQASVSLAVEQASDGFEAIDVAESFLPDLVVTDIHMPEMTGFQMIEQLQRRGLCRRFVVLTGYDDFEYARQAIRYQAMEYLLKPVNKTELIDLVQRVHREQAKEAEARKRTGLIKLRELIVRREHPDVLLIEKDEIEALFGGACRYAVASIRSPAPSVRPGPHEAFIRRLDELGTAKYEFHLRYKNETVLVLYGSETELEALELLKNELSASTDACEIGLSAAADDWRHLAGLYVQAQFEAFARKHFPGAGLRGDALDERRQSEALAALEDAAFSYRDDDAAERMNLYLSHLGIREANDPAALKRAFVQAIFHLQLALESAGVPWKPPTGGGWAEEASGFEDAEALKAKLFAELKQARVAADLAAPSEALSNQVVHKLLEYIRERYAEDIALDHLAELTDLHPNYISALFKKETGSTFVHYLQAHRVRKAKELIHRYPDQSLERIGLMVGYPNVSHFFRVFKKHAGCTPGQYREKAAP